MTEDSLSNDEYECVSPDDISLPPLAETPESGLVQSDFEEGFCFSSHSTHVNQHSHHDHAQSEQSGTGVVRQQRGSTEGYPPPPTNHSNPRSVCIDETTQILTLNRFQSNQDLWCFPQIKTHVLIEIRKHLVKQV